jgi:hypothetical protein
MKTKELCFVEQPDENSHFYAVISGSKFELYLNNGKAVNGDLDEDTEPV